MTLPVRRSPALLYALLTLCCDAALVTTSAADGPDGPVNPAPAEVVSDSATGTLKAEGDFGHDSNPTEGGSHALTKTHGPPDYFIEGQADGRVSLPIYPFISMVLRERTDVRTYQGDLPEDSALVHSEVQLPLRLTGPAELVPYGWVEDQWYGHDYYSTDQRGALRWTEHWSTDWDTDLVPYLERDRYRPPNRIEDAAIDGVDANLTWWVPGRCWLMAVTLGAGGALGNAHVTYASYKQDDVNVDQLWALPGLLRADLDLDWSPTYYEAFAPLTHKLRQDRAFTLDLHMTRPLLRWLVVVGDLSVLSVHSNFQPDQYHEIVMSIGLRITTW
jgi:hypothetical protein